MKKIIFISAVCGVGKSTTIEYMNNNKLLNNYDIFDIDDIINYHEYKNEPPVIFYEAAIRNALVKSKNKNIILGSCVNPVEIKQVKVPDSIDSIEMILLYCSEEELTIRLKERDINRNCSSDEFINGQIEYQKYMIDHSGLFQLKIDNTNINVKDVSKQIVDYIKNRERDIINEL